VQPSALKRNNVRIRGSGDRAMVFAHGFGCDQAMWRLVAPAFEDDFHTILYDQVGAGGSDLASYEPRKYEKLAGYADDLIQIGKELRLRDAVFVGHSVSCMIGVLADIQAPGMFNTLVLIGPSPRYIDDGGYSGGFTANEIDELLDVLASNHQGWSATMAPVIMGNPERPELGAELTESFCRMDPGIAKAFARATFTSDNRADLAKVTSRTLILQCTDDPIAPSQVGAYVQQHIPGSQLVVMRATGHCPNLSAPDETIAAIKAFV
jgi:sigma-B regulation protein RsbQ